MSEPAGAWEIVDGAVRAWAREGRDAFARAAEGVFSLIADPATVTPTERREVRAQATSDDALLVSWINECLYVHEIEGFLVQRVEVDTLDGGMVHGVLVGEEIDATRHRVGATVKTATSHGARVVQDGDRVEVSVRLEM